MLFRVLWLEREAELHQQSERTGAEFLWLWEVEQPAVVVGRSGKLDAEVKLAHCEADGVPVLRRASGGGAVVLARGCLNYTLILDLERRPALHDVPRSYTEILSAVARAAGVDVTGGDLTVESWKCGGCAQRRTRRSLLHHGTILYDFDARLATRYLREPARQPEYRQHRPHEMFLTNIAFDRLAFAESLQAAYPEAMRQ